MIRILLGQRGALLRGALATVLSHERDIDVIADLESRDEVLSVACRQRPDVVVLDRWLLGGDPANGLCRRLCRSLPACGVLIMLDRESCASASRVLARLAPQVGLIATQASPVELVEAVRRLARGRPVLDVELALAALTADEAPLTERERQVLRLAADGASTREIAEKLCLSAGTVRNYISRAISKTGGHNRIEAIRIAQDAGWI